MNKLSITTAILLGMTMTPALAEPSVEVMHFWTSGGEAAALSAVRDKVVSEGVKWTDAPVAGGGGDAAKTALQARIASGNPPAAMLMLGQNVIDWANEGLLTWVIVSVKSLPELGEIYKSASPFFNLLATIELGECSVKLETHEVICCSGR